MTPRTKAKLEENFNQLIADLGKLCCDIDELERMNRLIYNALRWTADDVLGQAVEDGYQPTGMGVE